ncbi:MAG: hypothetical protein Q7R49_02910 [Candidatus Daviesbacteria bacterium]|nr:hypothetical protein [Candidatus Daviesbacteria bacterium]
MAAEKPIALPKAPVTNRPFSDENLTPDPTPEIVDYLSNLLVLERKPLDQSVFDKDHQMFRRAGQYEKLLPTFLGDPEVLALGDDMRKREVWSETVSASYQREIDDIDRDNLFFQLQKEETAGNLQELSAQISGIGKERLRSGDLGLLVGRLQVELYDLKQKGRLNIFGRLAERLIGSRPVHPMLELVQNQLIEAEEKAKELEEKKRILAADHFKTETEQKHHLETEKEKLFHQLDDWVVDQSTDIFLVNYLYYHRPAVDKYLRSHTIDNEDQKILLGKLAQQQRVLQIKAELGSEVTGLEHSETAQLPMPVIINGQTITEIDLARVELASLNPSIPLKRFDQIFRKLVQQLHLEVQGSHHPQSKKFSADDPIIERTGGELRLRVGRYRILYNNEITNNGQRALGVVGITTHNDPKYQ